MEFEFKIDGAKALESLLAELPNEVAVKVADSAVRAGANVIKKEASARAPVYKGEVRIVKYRGKKRAIVPRLLKFSIAVRKDKQFTGGTGFQIYTKGKAFYAHFMEFGTKYITAKPFLRPALDEKAQEAFKRMVVVMNRGIQKAAVKLAAQYKTNR